MNSKTSLRKSPKQKTGLQHPLVLEALENRLLMTVSNSFLTSNSTASPSLFAPNHNDREQLIAPSTPPATINVTNTNDSGPGSLRWAIETANDRPGRDTIVFKIQNDGRNVFKDFDSHLPDGDSTPDAFVIRPEIALPSLTDTTGGTTINGQSQASFGGNTNFFGPEVVLDGSRIDATADGIKIWLHADGNRIEGLNIQNFPNNGISIVRSDNNVVSGNYIGTDPTGTTASPNGHTSTASAGGILITAGSKGNVIGGSGSELNSDVARNVISGNHRHGIRIQQGARSDETTRNVVRGNYIGSDATGRVSAEMGNKTYGVLFVSARDQDGVGANLVTANLLHGNGRGSTLYVRTSQIDNPLIGNFESFSGGQNDSDAGGLIPINNPLSGIPALNSMAPWEFNNDTKTIYLDFDGHSELFWLTTAVRTLPFTDIVIGRTRVGFYATNAPFTIDNNLAFSQQEIDIVRDIHQRVSEDFAPFNVNVTTIEPFRFERGEIIRVAIGGSDQDWLSGYQPWVDQPVTRAAGVDVGLSSVFVFSNCINFPVVPPGQSIEDIPCNIRDPFMTDINISGRNANSISHEVGHSFGLSHKSTRIDGMDVEYDPGDFLTTPIMGASMVDDRTIWANGPTPGMFQTGDAYNPSFQSDLDVLAVTIGYRNDDHSNSTRSPTWLSQMAPTYIQTDPRFAPRLVYRSDHFGVIERGSDKDVFVFRHEGGPVNIRVDAFLRSGLFGANLNARIELRNVNNQRVATSHVQEQVLANPDFPGSSSGGRWIDPNDLKLPDGSIFFEQLSAAIPNTQLRTSSPLRYSPSGPLVLGAGTYYVVVMSEGGYGDLGRHQISVSGITRGDVVFNAWENSSQASSSNSQFLGIAPDPTPDVPYLQIIADQMVVMGGENDDRIHFYSDEKDRIYVSINGKDAGHSVARPRKLVVFGGGGNDRITVSQTIRVPAEFHGGAGNDVLVGGLDDDQLSGGSGNDVIRGAGGNDVLGGGVGADRLWGNSGSDVLTGDSEADTLRGGSGHDQLRGGDGSDLILGNSGNDLISGGAGGDRLIAGRGNDRLIGQGGNDRLYGQTGNNILQGDDGNDRLFGGRLSDLLIGGQGSDILRSGKGDNLLIAGSTALDEDYNALSFVQAEWLSDRGFNQRVHNLIHSSGPVLDASDVFLSLSEAIQEDEERDVLVRGTGLDWMLAQAGSDRIVG